MQHGEKQHLLRINGNDVRIDPDALIPVHPKVVVMGAMELRGQDIEVCVLGRWQKASDGDWLLCGTFGELVVYTPGQYETLVGRAECPKEETNGSEFD